MSEDPSDQNDDVWGRETVPPSPVQPGDALGRYQIVEQIGRGGMGEVWKAFDPSENGPVVIKLLPMNLQGNSLEMERIRDSFRKVRKLQHRYICPVHDLGNDDRIGDFLVMKFIDGETLAAHRHRTVKSGRELTPQRVIEILRPIAEALDYAHDEKVVHRDVKPQNIMVRKDGSEPQLVDFGLAAEIRLTTSRITRGAVDTTGTFPYMAPEQWRGRQQDGRTDQYALGVVAYEMIAGNVPFELASPEIMRLCVLEDDPQEIDSLPAAANQALKKAMAKDPGKRFANCTEFIKALNAAMTQPPAKVPGRRSAPVAATAGVSGARGASPAGTTRPRMKESLFTGALILTVLAGGWLLRDDLFGTANSNQTASVNPPGPPPGQVALPPDSSQSASAQSPNPNVTPDRSAGATTNGNSGSTNTPTQSSPSSANSNPQTTPNPPTSQPNIQPGGGQSTNTPTATSPTMAADGNDATKSTTPVPSTDLQKQLAQQAQDAHDKAAAAKNAARNRSESDYAPKELARAEAAFAAGMDSFQSTKFAEATEQFNQAAMAFYESINLGRQAYQVSRDYRRLLQELSDIRDHAEKVKAPEYAPAEFSAGNAAQAAMQQEHQGKNYLEAAEKLAESKRAYQLAIEVAERMAQVVLAKKNFEAEIAGIAPEKLGQYGGQKWTDAMGRITAAQKDRDHEALEKSYKAATTLVPSIRSAIRQSEVQSISKSGNHREVLDLLWPTWNELDDDLKTVFTKSAQAQPQWWFERADDEIASVDLRAEAKAMLFVAIANAYESRNELKAANEYFSKALEQSTRLSDARKAMETTFQIAQEIDGKRNLDMLNDAITQLKVELGAMNTVGVQREDANEITWLKYFIPIRAAAMLWKAQSYQAADAMNQFAYASIESTWSFYSDLPRYQAMVVFAGAGDLDRLGSLGVVAGEQSSDRGRILISQIMGSRPYESLMSQTIYSVGINHRPPNGSDKYEVLGQVELALAYAQAGSKTEYNLHFRHAESMLQAYNNSGRDKWTISSGNARLAMAEAYGEEFVAAAGRIRNHVTHQMPLGEAYLTLGRRQLAVDSTAGTNQIKQSGIAAATATLTAFPTHPSSALLAQELAEFTSAKDFDEAINWMNALPNDNLRIAAIVGIGQALSLAGDSSD